MKKQNQFEIDGKLIFVYPLKKHNETFQSQDFVVEVIDSNDKGTFINPIKFDTTNNNCNYLKDLKIGNRIRINFALQGREWNKPTETVYITSLRAYKISQIDEYGNLVRTTTVDNTTKETDSIDEKYKKIEDITNFLAKADDLPF